MTRIVTAEAHLSMNSGMDQQVPQKVKHENGITLHFVNNQLDKISKNGFHLEVKDVSEALAKCGLAIVNVAELLTNLGNIKLESK